MPRWGLGGGGAAVVAVAGGVAAAVAERGTLLIAVLAVTLIVLVLLPPDLRVKRAAGERATGLRTRPDYATVAIDVDHIDDHRQPG
jgi:hypothetical protein